MFYYELALLKSPLSNLTYQSEIQIEIGTKVQVKLQRRKNLNDAVVIKEVEKPSFKCVNIEEITSEYYDEKMLQVSNFISQYYVSSLGEALSIYNAYNNEYKAQENEIKIDCDINLSKEQQEAFRFFKQ